MSIYNIDLRHLRYFLAVAEELNFSRAAARLHICQPPLSQQIQEMEARLQTKLFARTKRKVELTNAGQHLVGIAKNILRDLENGLHMTKSIGAGHIGELKIGIVYSAPLVPAFGKCIKTYRTRHPNIQLSFKEMRHQHLLNALKNNEIDAAFLWQDQALEGKSLATRMISKDYMSFFVSETHPLASQKLIKLSDLSAEVLHLTSMQAKLPFMLKLREMAHKHNCSLRISEEALHFPVIANMVAVGNGIGILPLYVAGLATSKLIPKKLQGFAGLEMPLTLNLCYRANDKNAALLQFLKLTGKS